jgi:hypothetical protein
MTPKDWVGTALRALAEQDREREAPEEVEGRLLAAFKRRRARKKVRTVALATLAVAAAMTLFFARTQPQPQPKQIAPVLVSQQPIVVAAAPATMPVPVPKATPKARPVKRQPQEVVTQFFPLLDVAPPFESGELLRVTVPASTMRTVGLPVNEDHLTDRVYADVLVGQEGLARAIRFVSYEQ